MTIEVEVDFSDVEAWVSNLEQQALEDFTEAVAIELFGETSREAPVDHGRLAGSVQFPEKTGEYEYVIEINAEYWEHVQFGTDPHLIEPVNKEALHFVVSGESVFAKWVLHPGTEPNPFIDRAIENVEPEIPDIAEEYLGP